MNKNSVGRLKKKVYLHSLITIHQMYLSCIITLEEAIKRSKAGLKATYYRRVKEMQQKHDVNFKYRR